MPEKEQTLAAAVLAEVARSFDRPSVTLGSTFSDMRADSVSILRLTNTLQERFDVSIDIVDMFQAEKVDDLVELIARLTSTDAP